jgi:hypothetical protein
VGVRQRLAGLQTDHERLGRAEPPAPVEHGPEAAAAEVLRHQVGPVGLFAPVEHGHDVGVVEGRRGPGLGPEPAQEGLVVGQRRVQDLDRHPPAQAHVVGQEHMRRRAGSNRSEEAVPASQDATEVVRYPGRSHGRKATVRGRPTTGNQVRENRRA